jgi:DNA mismatch repair protein MutS
MPQIDRRALERQLRQEFPTLTLVNWYVQYRQLKAGHPDAILLYRMGDFYEAFDDDAKLVAEQLDVTLTYKHFANHKQTGEKQLCPMAGMPYHAIERYVGDLVGRGYRVAIAEQISETPSSKSDTRPKSVFAAGLEQRTAVKGMVEREVVRVITPGTVTDAGMLAAAQNNYLAAVLVEQRGERCRVGLAYADLSTGEFYATEFGGDRAATQAQGELARLQAAEVLVPDDELLRLPGLDPSSAQLTHDLEFMTKEEREMLLPGERVARRIERANTARWAHGHVTAYPAWRWDGRTARDALLQHFGVQSLASFELGDKPLATRAAGAVIQYVNETLNGAVMQMTTLRTYTTGTTMFLDPQTRRNLELLEGSGGGSKGALINVLDQTRTPMGARLLRRWLNQPLLDIARLRARHDAVAHFADDALLRAEVRDALKQVGDMERVVNRVLQGVTIATPRDLVRLREALRALPKLLDTLDGWLPPDEKAEGRKQKEAGAQPLDELFAHDREEAELAESDAEHGSDNNLQSAIANLQSSGPSLREQREARRHAVPRYEEDDLFGEDGWDEEPVAVSNQQPAASSQRPQQVTSDWRQPTGDSRLATRLDACADVLELLERALDDDPPALLGASNYLRATENGEQPRRVIRPGFDRQMDDVVAASRDAQAWIARLEEREQKRTGIKSLRVDYNKVFGYYIEVPKSYANDVPGDYVRKQTLVTGERYFTSELKEYETIVLNAQERLNDLERRAFTGLCTQIAEHGMRMLATARALAEVDVYAGLAEAAVRGRYVRPTLHDDTRLRIVAGRHPVVEQALDGDFIANDALLNTDENQILIITGPNMAGKSTVLRQIALIVLMAQIGSFVPAEQAEIGIVDRIFTRIGAQDDIATGQSTFMVEMTETAALLLQSTRRSLIILDEVGRGTSTYDGMAIARAVVEYIHNEPRLGCRTLFATHYHELTELEQLLPRVKNYHMAAIEHEGRVVFLHELRRGGADQSYGIHVAELAGIPRAVIRRASELLAELEQRPSHHAHAPEEPPVHADGPASPGQLSLFDLAPHPVIEMIRRLDVNALTPLEALTKLFELQRLAQRSD